jgi:sugar/nucleoside kinase (ribokinase family)
MKVATVGEILVEMVASTRGEGFVERQDFAGPFASGAPAIFVDQVAKMGLPCTIFGAVGDDDFGRVNIERLRSDGVDTSNIAIVPGLPTGIAFVRYRADGSRSFLFTLKGSASERVPATADNAALEGISHLHIMGSSLGSPRLAAFIDTLAAQVKGRSGTISLDPNLRLDLLKGDMEEAQATLRRRAMTADFLLPSEGELGALATGDTDEERIDFLLEAGIPEIVLKQGAAGATAFTRAGITRMAAPRVTEVDPTGAGDIFGATYVAARLSGSPVEQALRYAVNAGAHSVTCLGPMEGTITRAELDLNAAAA